MKKRLNISIHKEVLKPHFAEKFEKQYKKLPLPLQKKFTKQMKLLLQDFRHPSLKSRKMQGQEVYEARLDYHNRFIYKIWEDEIWFIAIGPHDEGLGRK